MPASLIARYLGRESVPSRFCDAGSRDRLVWADDRRPSASHGWPGILARSGRPAGQSGEGTGMGPRIAIIGGGIGGLTAAVALARKGLAAEVYEQAPVLEEVGAGVGLWPNALTALAPIGLAGKVAQLAVKLAGQGIKRPDGAWLLRIPGEVMAQRWGAGPVLVHRAELQQLLASELGRSFIHLGAR